MIEDIPDLPPEIISAVNNKKLAIFIGAGISRMIGCSDWASLSNNLINRCHSTEISGKPLINFKEKESISQMRDYKKIISICYGIMENNKCQNMFFKEFEESLKPKKDLISKRDIYKELFNFLNDPSGLRGIFLTTNADGNFKDYFKDSDVNVVYRKEDFESVDVGKIHLYYLHGLYPYKDSLVFTVKEYISRYNDKNFIKTLKKIFNEYNVLFLGYGLNELEVLDFLITKLDLEKSTKTVKKEYNHFILLPYYSNDDNILNFDQLYYEELGIKVIGYEKDNNGYNQLYHVIKDWAEQLKGAPSLYDDYAKVDEVIK